ncbi:hypothetical protein Tsubulata_023891 [Turnera subulata]|uniref:Uncharacterized protein n=1 Tax=Turnera subulata TaxID=218843 RepID=A0A9Q0JHE1_9ROSI|nr:hypothetical protein Tsubulata_023891 [Turnera subulata]
MATAETLKFHEIRQRFKDQIRKDIQRENRCTDGGGGPTSSSNAPGRDKQLLSAKINDFATFFGPSQTVIAKRLLLQEDLSCLGSNNNNLPTAFRVLCSTEKDCVPATGGVNKKDGSCKRLRRSTVDSKLKIQRLRETRDYSFLLSDEPAPVKVEAAAPVAGGGKSSAPDLSKESKSVSLGGAHSASKPHPHNKPSTPVSTRKPTPNKVSMKQLHGDKKGSLMPIRHPAELAKTKKSQAPERQKSPVSKDCSVKKPSSSVSKDCSVKKPLSSISKDCSVKKPLSSASKDRTVKKSFVYEDSAVKKRPSTVVVKQRHRRPDDDNDESDDSEGEKALRIIRKMFKTDRFIGRNDADVNMEANFHEILREERRSERLGRKEDQEQLRLILEEERLERMGRSSKKHKPSQIVNTQ